MVDIFAGGNAIINLHSDAFLSAQIFTSASYLDQSPRVGRHISAGLLGVMLRNQNNGHAEPKQN